MVELSSRCQTQRLSYLLCLEILCFLCQVFAFPTFLGSRSKKRRVDCFIRPFESVSLQLESISSSNNAAHIDSAAAISIPLDPATWPDRFPAKEHCSRCGLCETTFVRHVTEACAFLGDAMSRIDGMEPKVHGRPRHNAATSLVWDNDSSSSKSNNNNELPDEARFGVMYEPMMLAQGVHMTPQAQWTGVVTSIAVAVLEAGLVDAVVCVAAADPANSSDHDHGSWSSWSTPQPILARTTDQVLRGRGVKPALAPSLNVLDEIHRDPSIESVLFCGVGCAVQALRAVQDRLNATVYVLGTNCVDNSPTPQAAERFLREGFQLPMDDDDIPRGYEFMQDFRVHVKTDRGYFTKPYFSLPGTIAEPSIATSCLACSDYTNALADVVVGYMGAPLLSSSGVARMDQSWQTLTVRNARGAQMVQTALSANRLKLSSQQQPRGKGRHERLTVSTVASDSIVQGMIGGRVPEAGMPVWLGEIFAEIMTNFVAPKGISFARYSIDYHLLRNYLHMLDAWGEDRARRSMPPFARDIVDHYLQNHPTVAQLAVQVERRRGERIVAKTQESCINSHIT